MGSVIANVKFSNNRLLTQAKAENFSVNYEVKRDTRHEIRESSRIPSTDFRLYNVNLSFHHFDLKVVQRICPVKENHFAYMLFYFIHRFLQNIIDRLQFLLRR
jgi:hypothetical protein